MFLYEKITPILKVKILDFVWETSDEKLLCTCFLWYTAGKDVWSSEEDKILLSKDKEAISNLAKKRGLQSVLNRINFIEGIN